MASFAFRYSEAKAGTASLPETIDRLNVRRFGDAMTRLAFLLDKLVDAADFFHENFGPAT